MFKPLIISSLGLTAILAGCTSPGVTDGGDSGVVYKETTMYVDDNGNLITETTEVKVDVNQPESPIGPAEVTIDKPKGGPFKIKASVPGAQNNAGLVATIGLLNYPIYAGIGLIVAGLLVGFLLKNVYWSLAIGGTGVAMIVGSYLLATYSVWFMLGLVILMAYGGYLLWDYLRQKKSAKETIEVVETAKKKGIIDTKAFHELANNVQSDSTKDVVDEVQQDIKDKEVASKS